MVERKVYRIGESKLLVSIPSFLRDKLHMKSCKTVDVTDVEGKIVITPIREQ
jgi:antitoxin component of MazEF toxin-antitoxin module